MNKENKILGINLTIKIKRILQQKNLFIKKGWRKFYIFE